MTDTVDSPLNICDSPTCTVLQGEHVHSDAGIETVDAYKSRLENQEKESTEKQAAEDAEVNAKVDAKVKEVLKQHGLEELPEDAKS